MVEPSGTSRTAAPTDLVWVIGCPEEQCRYQEGSARMGGRIAYTRRYLEEIGLEPERLGHSLVQPGKAGVLEGAVQEARLFPMGQFMAETFAAAILCERAEWEFREFGDDRKSVVATLYTERYLTDRNRLRDIDAPASLALDRFDDLVAGALVDNRPR